MIPKLHRLSGRSLWALLALTSAVAITAPASGAAPSANSAATRVLHYKCQGQTPLGAVHGFAYQDVVSASAPSSVASNQEFDIVIRPGRNSMPLTIDDRRVGWVRDITLKMPAPTNATVLSHSLSGGWGTGVRPVQLSVSGGHLVFKIAGPIYGAAPFQLPTVKLRVRAGANGPVTTHLGDYNQSNPSLTFTAKIHGRRVVADVPAECYPKTNHVLTSTTVT